MVEKHNVYPKGNAFIDGKPLAERDRCFGFQLADCVVDWTAELRGAATALRPRRHGPRAQGISAFSGGSTFPGGGKATRHGRYASTPFRQLVTDSGYFLPVEAFKRLAWDWSLDKGAAPRPGSTGRAVLTSAWSTCSVNCERGWMPTGSISCRRRRPG